jgi:hypothetical protein
MRETTELAEPLLCVHCGIRTVYHFDQFLNQANLPKEPLNVRG